MATQPDTAPDTINPGSPAEMPPMEQPSESPGFQTPEVTPNAPDYDQPGRVLPETPPPPG